MRSAAAAVYEGKGQCATCHRVNGVGSRVAPDLSDIGSARQAAALHRSLIEPTKGMWPINRPVRIVTRDGRTISGRRLNEDTFTIQLIDANERLVAIDKSEIKRVRESRRPRRCRRLQESCPATKSPI